MSRGLIQPATWRSTTLIVSETGLIMGAVGISAYGQLGAAAGPDALAATVPHALLITGICQLCLYYGDLYDNPRAGGDRGELLIRTLQALGVTLLILAGIYTMFPTAVPPHGVLAPTAVLAMGLVFGWRIAFAWVARSVAPHERLLLVGTSGPGLALARELEEREELGVQIAGLVDEDPSAAARAGLPFIGGIEDIPAIVRARSIDRVVVSLADARGKLPMDKLLEMKLDGVSFDHLASVYEEYTGKIAVENLRPSWLIFSPGFRKTRSLLAIKRLVDIAGAAIGLVLSGPLVLVLAATIKLTSAGPAFYAQRRVGLHGRLFTVFKLRSMCVDAERDSGPVWVTTRTDVRVTRLGRVLRRTRLDELPQLWNILIGQMSLVGPRPERPEFVSDLARQIPFYGQRHVVKPGLTGWAQVRYTYGASVEDALEKLQYDLYYIKNLSLTLDLYILFETVKTVLLRRGQ